MDGMKALEQFQSKEIQVVLTDIDGTLTDNGRLPSESYSRMWQLSRAGFKVIPVTGRPAGWCELIARLWPVHGVVGENGAFYFTLQNGKMLRRFVRSPKHRKRDREQLRKVRVEALEQVPGCAVSSDQFSRLFDLAIDFSEDVKPLSADKILKIVKIFESHGAHAKVSNIHVNGWFGDYDKVTTCQKYLAREFRMSPLQMQRHCIFVGDSPNDEPMFQYFENSFAVANIKDFIHQLKAQPRFVAQKAESHGFCEIADRLLVLQSR
jgi:HAD superfamily hydrolase (TIGR01484 family)